MHWHVHVMTDLYTAHCYTQDFDKFREQMKAEQDENHVYRELTDRNQEYRGQPYFLDEYGGTMWPRNVENLEEPEDIKFCQNDMEAFYKHIEGLTNIILETDYMSGYTYTQLTDVEHHWRQRKCFAYPVTSAMSISGRMQSSRTFH